MDFAILLWVLRRIGSASWSQSPTLCAQQKVMERTAVSLEMRSGSVMWVSSRLKPRVFKAGEEGLDLPALGVDGQGLLGRVVGHDDQQFAGLEMERGDEDGPGLGFSGLREAPGVGEDAAFPGFEVAKQLPRLGPCDHACWRS